MLLLFGGEERDMSRSCSKKCYIPSIPTKLHINSVLLCTFMGLARVLHLAVTFSRTDAGVIAIIS